MKAVSKRKRRVMILIAFAVILCCVAAVLLPYQARKHYFQRLSLDDIASIKVHSTRYIGNDLPAKPLEHDDMLTVYELLKEVELKGRPSIEYRKYVPMWTQMFLIELTDGTVIEFAATYPFYIIDIETGFRAERTTCKELQQLFYTLSAAYFPE